MLVVDNRFVSGLAVSTDAGRSNNTAKAAFIYVLYTEPYAYVDAHRHRCVLAQPKGQLSIANYL